MTQADIDNLIAAHNALPEEHKQTQEISIPGDDIRVGLKIYAYPDFGLFIYRSKRFYLAIRCGAIGQNGIGGHAHNDQLAIELNIDGIDRIIEPGTYLYKPLPLRRNEYRSVKAHFTPKVKGRKPGRLGLQLFCLGNQAKAECLYFGRAGFVGRHRGFGVPIYRIVQVLETGLCLMDYVEATNPSKRRNILARVNKDIHKEIPVSPAYGVVLRRKPGTADQPH